MNPILEWGISLIAWLQASVPWLRGPMQFASFLGSEEFFMLLLPFLYWCVDARLGARVGIILCISSNVNDLFKFAFHAPRPYWVSHRVQAMSSETSYGLPSGHAQHAMSIWGVIGTAGKGWLRWAMAAVIFLIGFSRIVLAVHFPTDVLLGWLIGGLVLWAFLRWEAPVLAWVNRHTLTQKIG
jgi:membrane-associated phospholipid phosphatase